MKTLVVMGRGGVGKTTFTALAARHLIRCGEAPILLVDLDPDQSLGEMVGVDMESSGRKTIAELVTDTFIGGGGTTVGVAPRERIESRIWEQGLWEGDSFDFLAVGTKWVEGCYCLPDAALKGALGAITRNYRHVLIDAPAGLEHLNRRVTTSIDDLFEILGPSRKSFAHVARAYRVAREVGISFSRFLGVGGYLFPGDLEEEARRIPHLSYLGRFPRDPAVAALGLAGGSLLDLPDGSPAVVAVREILARAGYPSR
jgi:CO dehydrogenase maturation factor